MTEDKKAQSEDKKAEKATPEELAAKAHAEAVEHAEEVEADKEASDEDKRAAVLAARLSPDIGVDGVNPVTPNNPPRGSQPDVARPHD